MNFVETVAPISIENLKKYFTDKTTFFIINYKESNLKGTKLLTYLSNLDIPCDINPQGCTDEEVYDLIKDYLNTSMIVNIPVLEKAVIHLLHQYKKLSELKDENFINDNSEILGKWVSRLESLSLYNMHIIDDDKFKDFTNKFEKQIDFINKLVR